MFSGMAEQIVGMAKVNFEVSQRSIFTFLINIYNRGTVTILTS
mgnify:CR=1 FL=1